MSIPVGLNVWSRLVERIFPYLDKVLAPFDSLWTPDHVQNNGHKVGEGWTLLSFALGRYPDKTVGHQVLCNSFRNPAHLAKMVATAQAISGGRVVLGIGAGWNEAEYLSYGWPFPTARERIAQLAEAIRICRLMWTEAPANFEGQHYQIKDAYCEPVPDPTPPVMVGGSGEKYTLRVVAEQADWWNHVFEDLETYRHKQEVLKSHCRAVGRDYDEIKQVVCRVVFIAENEKELNHLKADPNVRSGGNSLVGTPEQVTETLLKEVDQGADMFVVNLSDAPRVEGTHLFAAEVMPHLKR